MGMAGNEADLSRMMDAADFAKYQEYDPNNGESTGKDNGKRIGNCHYVEVYRVMSYSLNSLKLPFNASKQLTLNGQPPQIRKQAPSNPPTAMKSLSLNILNLKSGYSYHI